MGEGLRGERKEEQSMYILGTIHMLHAHGGRNKCIKECICSVLCSAMELRIVSTYFH